MAQKDRRLESNAPGNYFVDSTCIDCEACRWIAPATFSEHRGTSRVHHQPASEPEMLRAQMALIACPTASIGTELKQDLSNALTAFPDPIDGPVYHCGYHARSSYGAASYLIVRPEGNILVDSPRFSAPLVRQLEALGGVRWMFLTHRDDVADHQKFHEHFSCERILHRDDVSAGTRMVERQIGGIDPVKLDDEVTFIPVPGHTQGSMCLLFRETWLFSGDHVAWDPDPGRVIAFREACWYDWEVQRESMSRLARYRFEWILPGHGWRCHLPAPTMMSAMDDCVKWMVAAS